MYMYLKQTNIALISNKLILLLTNKYNNCPSPNRLILPFPQTNNAPLQIISIILKRQNTDLIFYRQRLPLTQTNIVLSQTE